MKGFLHSMLGFSCYKICYFIYFNFTKYWRAKRKGERERERERERESISASTIFKEDIESLYVLFVFIYIFGKCLIFVSDWDT